MTEHPESAHSEADLYGRRLILLRAANPFFQVGVRRALPEGRARYPKFRKKFENESFRYPDPKQIKVEDCRIFLPKAGWVRMVKHREIIGDVKNVTVSRHGTYWFVSVQVQREVDEPMLKIGAAEGVDLGVVNALTLSDGTVYALPRRKSRSALPRCRSPYRAKPKARKNRIQAKLRLQRHQAKLARRRKDAKHKLTTAVSRRVAVLCLKGLKVRNMTPRLRALSRSQARTSPRRRG
jgi:putative transposase